MPLATYYVNFNNGGSCPNGGNAVGPPDGVWTTGGNTNVSWTNEWSFNNNHLPAFTPTGTQTLLLTVRKGTNTGNPVINSITLTRGGSTLVAFTPNLAVTSTTGTTVSYTFNASVLSGVFNPISVSIVTTGTGGSGSNRNTVELDAIGLEIQYVDLYQGTLNATATVTG